MGKGVSTSSRFRIGMMLTLGFLLPAVLVLILYYPLFSIPGYIFHGDEGWYFYFNSHVVIKDMVYAWVNDVPNTSNSIPYYIVELPLTVLGSYGANHALVFLLAYLPGVIAYFSIYKTIGLLYPNGGELRAILASAVGSTFYLINWQNYGLTNPMLTWSFSYMILPALTYLLIKIYKERKVGDILLFSIISVVGDPLPAWMLFIGIEAILIFIGVLIVNIKSVKNLIATLKVTVYLIAFTFVANAFVFFETVAGFLFRAGGAYLTFGSPVSEISLTKSLSFYNFRDVIMFGQSKFYFFGVNPQNWTPLNISIITFAIFLFIFIVARKEVKQVVKYVSSLFFIMLLGSLFLAKGFNPPLGGIYKYVILASPPGIVGITRDVESWLILAALCYSFIYSLGVYVVFSYLSFNIKRKTENQASKIDCDNHKKDLSTKKMSISLKKVVVLSFTLLLLFSSLASALYTTNVEFDSYTYPAFSPRYLPEPYIVLSAYIQQYYPNEYVTWIPYSGEYSWEDNYSIKNVITNLGGVISEHFVNPSYLYPFLDRANFTSLATLLSYNDIRLLIVDTSGIPPNGMGFQETLSFLKTQTNLVQIYEIGWLYVFENTENLKVVQSGIPSLNGFLPDLNGTQFIPGLNSYDVYLNSSSPYYMAYLTGLLAYSKEITNIGWGGAYGSFAVFKAYMTNYAYNASLFSINDVERTGDNLSVNLTYHIPQLLRNYSKISNGKFFSGFSPEIQLFPNNENPEWVSMIEGGTNRAYLQLSYIQHEVNNTTGYLDFTIPFLPETSLYINYYGESFTDISLLYYIASINDKGQFEEMPLEIKYSSNFSAFEKMDNNELVKPYVIQIAPPEIITGNVNGISYKNALYDDALYVQPISVYQNVSLGTFYDVLNSSNLILGLYMNNISGSDVFVGHPVNNILFRVNNSTVLHFATPIPEDYNITVKVLNGMVSFANRTLPPGEYQFRLHLSGFGSLIFKSINAVIAVNINLTHSQYRQAVIGDIIKNSPVQYSFAYISSTDNLVIFSKPYSPLWIAYFDGKKYAPISINGGNETGFLLPPGAGLVIIYYELQTYLDIGSIITIIFLCFAVAFFVRRRFHG